MDNVHKVNHKVLSLHDALKSPKYNPVRPKSYARTKHVLQLVEMAFQRLHRRGIVHGDAHGDNVFLVKKYANSKPTIQFIDFGMAAYNSAQSRETAIIKSHVEKYSLKKNDPLYKNTYFGTARKFETFVPNKNKLAYHRKKVNARKVQLRRAQRKALRKVR